MAYLHGDPSCAVGHLRDVTGGRGVKKISSDKALAFITAITNRSDREAGAEKALAAAGFALVATGNNRLGRPVTFWVKTMHPHVVRSVRRSAPAR